MAALVPTQITMLGAVDALVPASGGGDTFTNDGEMVFEVLNGGGASITVTFTVPALVQGNAIVPPAIVVPAGARRKIGSFAPELFDSAAGTVAVAYSAVTTVTVGVFRL